VTKKSTSQTPVKQTAIDRKAYLRDYMREYMRDRRAEAKAAGTVAASS
jgi:hypothetical protein